MPSTYVHWLLFGGCAVVLHLLALLTWDSKTIGAASAPQGPSVMMAASMASVLSQDVSANTTANVGIPTDAVVAENAPPLTSTAALEEVGAQRLTAIETVEPAVVLPVTELQNPVEEIVAVLAVPKPKTSKQSLQSQNRTKERQTSKPKSRKRKSKNRKSKRDAKNGAKRQSNSSGNKARGGGKGRATASKGAISSFRSAVRARIAACVRRRVRAGRSGRVVVRFAVSPSGRPRGVSASGTSAFRSAATAAARGCSFPRPPSGAGRLRFAFPISIR